MAKIKGFQMKNVKRTIGREGEGCTATLYLNGKRIGAYADYADGAGGNVDYESADAKAEMRKFIISYAKDHPNAYIVNLYKERPAQYQETCENFKKMFPYIPDEDITMETMSANDIDYVVDDFLFLYGIEKYYKKVQKNGYHAVFASDKRGEFIAYPANWNNKKIEDDIKKDGMTGKIYYELSDFDIE